MFVFALRRPGERGGGGGTLNLEVIGMLVGNFFKNPINKYPGLILKP